MRNLIALMILTLSVSCLAGMSTDAPVNNYQRQTSNYGMTNCSQDNPC